MHNNAKYGNQIQFFHDNKSHMETFISNGTWVNKIEALSQLRKFLFQLCRRISPLTKNFFEWENIQRISSSNSIFKYIFKINL